MNWLSEHLIFKVWLFAHHVFLLTLSWSPRHPEVPNNQPYLTSWKREHIDSKTTRKLPFSSAKAQLLQWLLCTTFSSVGVKDYYECSLKCCRQESFPAVFCWMQKEDLGEAGSLSEDTSSSWVYISSKCQQQGQSHHVSLLDCSCSALLKYLLCLQSKTSACTWLGCLDNIISSGCTVNKIWESDWFQLSNSAKL